MKLPGNDRAVVPRLKVTGYLLSDIHPIGRFKARVFRALGFRLREPDVLVSQLLRIAREGEVESTEDNPYGRSYLVPGTLAGPAGSAEVSTVWFIATGTDSPSLVTVFPR